MTQKHIPRSTSSLPLSGEPEPLPVISVLAILSVVAGVLGVIFVLPFVGPLAALVMGAMGANEIEASRGQLMGRRVARAGTWLGGIGLVLNVGALVLLMGIVIPHRRAQAKQATFDRMLSTNQENQHKIFHALVAYADANNGHMPGVNRDGKLVSNSVEARLQALLDDSLILPDFLISPAEQHKRPLQDIQTGQLTRQNYSYAMLDLGHPNRLAEWRTGANSAAPLLCDHNRVANPDMPPQSIWTQHPDGWAGDVTWGDGHVTYESSPVMPRTVYNSVPHVNDNLFVDEGRGDAYMIFGQ